jgi:hypothetical protein
MIETLELRFGLSQPSQKLTVTQLRGLGKVAGVADEAVGSLVASNSGCGEGGGGGSVEQLSATKSPLQQKGGLEKEEEEEEPLEDVHLGDDSAAFGRMSESGAKCTKMKAAALSSGVLAAVDRSAKEGEGDGSSSGSSRTVADVAPATAEAAAAAVAAAPVLTGKQKCFRIGVVAATGLTAALVPNLGALIALAGAITGPLIAVVLPALIDFRTPRSEKGFNCGRALERKLDVLFIVVGSVCGMWSFVAAVRLVLQGDSVGE